MTSGKGRGDVILTCIGFGLVVDPRQVGMGGFAASHKKTSQLNIDSRFSRDLERLEKERMAVFPAVSVTCNLSVKPQKVDLGNLN